METDFDRRDHERPALSRAASGLRPMVQQQHQQQLQQQQQQQLQHADHSGPRERAVIAPLPAAAAASEFNDSAPGPVSPHAELHAHSGPNNAMEDSAGKRKLFTFFRSGSSGGNASSGPSGLAAPPLPLSPMTLAPHQAGAQSASAAHVARAHPASAPHSPPSVLLRASTSANGLSALDSAASPPAPAPATAAPSRPHSAFGMSMSRHRSSTPSASSASSSAASSPGFSPSSQPSRRTSSYQRLRSRLTLPTSFSLQTWSSSSASAASSAAPPLSPPPPQSQDATNMTNMSPFARERFSYLNLKGVYKRRRAEHHASSHSGDHDATTAASSHSSAVSGPASSSSSSSDTNSSFFSFSMPTFSRRAASASLQAWLAARRHHGSARLHGQSSQSELDSQHVLSAGSSFERTQQASSGGALPVGISPSTPEATALLEPLEMPSSSSAARSPHQLRRSHSTLSAHSTGSTHSTHSSISSHSVHSSVSGTSSRIYSTAHARNVLGASHLLPGRNGPASSPSLSRSSSTSSFASASQTDRQSRELTSPFAHRPWLQRVVDWSRVFLRFLLFLASISAVFVLVVVLLLVWGGSFLMQGAALVLFSSFNFLSSLTSGRPAGSAPAPASAPSMSSSNPMFGRPAASFFSTFSWMILAAIAALIYSSTKAKSSPVNQDRFIARRAEVRGRGIKREAGAAGSEITFQVVFKPFVFASLTSKEVLDNLKVTMSGPCLVVPSITVVELDQDAAMAPATASPSSTRHRSSSTTSTSSATSPLSSASASSFSSSRVSHASDARRRGGSRTTSVSSHTTTAPAAPVVPAASAPITAFAVEQGIDPSSQVAAAAAVADLTASTASQFIKSSTSTLTTFIKQSANPSKTVPMIVANIVYTASRPGTFKVRITFDGFPIAMEHYTVHITPGDIDPSKCDISGDCIQRKLPVRGDEAGELRLTLTTRDRFGSPRTGCVSRVDKFVLLIDGEPVDADVTDCGNGVLSLVHVPLAARLSRATRNFAVAAPAAPPLLSPPASLMSRFSSPSFFPSFGGSGPTSDGPTNAGQGSVPAIPTVGTNSIVGGLTTGALASAGGSSTAAAVDGSNSGTTHNVGYIPASHGASSLSNPPSSGSSAVFSSFNSPASSLAVANGPVAFVKALPYNNNNNNNNSNSNSHLSGSSTSAGSPAGSAAASVSVVGAEMAHPVLVPQAVPAAMSACGLKSCVVMYDGAVVGDGPFDVLFLSTEDTRTVDKCLSHTETWFEGQMRLPGSTTMDIWIKVTPDTILFAAYILRVIARRQYTGRIAPNLQVALSRADSQKFIIGARRIEVTCAQRNILYALLMRLAANRTGCVSNNFADKQVYFSEELRNQHPEDARQVQTRIIVDRLNLLRSAQATIGGLSDVQLRLLNHVQFENEQGIDHGGLRREFFTVLCAQLFGEQTGLFAKLDSSSSCVHPVASKLNAHSRDRLSLYRFAGTVLGKVVYDTCARGSPLFVNVRLSQSMRRYLLGLSCSVADFEVDDPAFFRTKIFYVQTNNMDALDETSGLELFFAEEEYDNQGRVRKIVEFKPNGSRLRVTEANKGDYLQLLSEYRLVRRVHHQLEAFAKGFRSVIDEDLVCIFSDREMELLFCGLPSVDVDDFRRHTAYIGYSITSEPIQWFWMVVRNFSQEQRARLLQFITGSSQVPLGGFVNYRPSITISYRATTRRLPCAHTCANTLDLPHYLSFEELQDKLSLAIAEGSEGFGFA